ncbi:MAG: RagB/SusD family nutrient uptake outer membrane protein [Odoribacter sp.]|nr:RagB/SusD family nutrient uptake outer membrane protein [Odoribacter sp.]
MKTLIKYSCIAFLAVCQLSCSNWLDIGSEDRIMEKDLFGTKDGFLTALNGIYIDLLDNSLYGRTLTYGTMDILAQYYDCSDREHSYYNLARYDSETKRDAVSSTWTKAWFLINNVNTLLEHCEEDRAVLDDRDYHIIRGEALALRALLHFELFRIFGPVYNLDPEEKCLPYVRSSDLVVREMLPAVQVQEFILNDLREAERMLADYDPVITEGPLFSDAGNGLSNAMRYRPLRLNYYAVQAYIARVALYVGNSSLAGSYAEKVIKGTQEDNQWFPFIERAAAEDVDHRDRIYQPEILFGVYNLNRKSIFDGTFSNNLSAVRVLRPTDDYIDWMYDHDINDLRYAYHWELLTSVNQDEGNLQYFVKYKEVDDGGKGFQYLVPLMRISEMYLIAAECTDEGVQYLNALRAARKIADVPEDARLMDEIEKEYRREFIGEGQLFWFFKRRNQSDIVSGSGSEIGMNKEDYLFRMPQEEEDHRGTNY